VDVFGSYDYSEGVSIYAGIDNLFDEEPPLSVDGYNDNTDVRTFDTIGRYYYIGFKAAF
jgi:outer membrane receptor protein involved in Fe transport